MPTKHRFIVCLLLCLASTVAVANSAPEDTARPVPESPTRALAPLLLINGGDTNEADQWYQAAMDSMFGVGYWDEYNMPEQGLPDPPELFLGILRQYQGVIWHAGYSGLDDLVAAKQLLIDYAGPDAGGIQAGKLLLIIPRLYQVLNSLGSLPADVLGIHSFSAPLGPLDMPYTSTALALVTDLPNLTSNFAPVSPCTGIQPLEGSEVLYQMEYCVRCYSSRQPFDPVVGVRTPNRETSLYAKAITLTVPLHRYYEGWHALEQILQYHMGYIPSSTYASGAGIVQLAVNNSGFLGNFFSNPSQPSMVYPFPSYVEHLYHAGIWVGARLPDGSLRVSTSADHYSLPSAAAEVREFAPTEDETRIISNLPENPNYDPTAIAPWQLECSFTDDMQNVSGQHQPLGIKVLLRATSWNLYPINDGVVLEYRVVNESGADLRDVYFGFFNDTTVGNTLINDPYSLPGYSTPAWNFYDDMNGGWQPGDLSGDPDIWMMWEHDDDGDGGWAESWVGCRLLSSSHEMHPPQGVAPVSYNAWWYRQGPEEDDTYFDIDNEIMVPGRYQAMGNGDFDSGVTADDDFTVASDWLAMLSTGPVPTFANGDTLTYTYALLCGDNQWELSRNSFRLKELEASGYDSSLTPVVNNTPHNIRLEAAVPNPFNPTTKIRFSLDQPGWTRLEVYGVDGRLVSILVDEVRPSGQQEVSWHGRDHGGNAVASGTYLYRLTAPGGARLVGHMTLLK